jgi:hypothetical protein
MWLLLFCASWHRKEVKIFADAMLVREWRVVCSDCSIVRFNLTARCLTTSYFIAGILLEVTEVTYLLCHNVRRAAVVGIATGLWAGGSGIWIPTGTIYFILSKTFVPALGPTQPPVEWVPGFFLDDKAADREVTTDPPFNDEVKNQWSCTFAPSVCLNGVDDDHFTVYLCLSVWRNLRFAECFVGGWRLDCGNLPYRTLKLWVG